MQSATSLQPILRAMSFVSRQLPVVVLSSGLIEILFSTCCAVVRTCKQTIADAKATQWRCDLSRLAEAAGAPGALLSSDISNSGIWPCLLSDSDFARACDRAATSGYVQGEL